MKKEYKAPEVKMIEFDYTDNVVASGNAKGGDDKCHTYTDPCTGETKFCHNWSTKACAWG